MKGYAVKIDDVLSAPELEALILRLAMARAAMAPPVPKVPPKGVKELKALDALFTVTPSPVGLLFRFRSEAFGWITYEVSAAACLGFQDWFAAWCASQTGQVVTVDEYRSRSRH